MAELMYKGVSKWRYLVEQDCTIPILNKDLQKRLRTVTTTHHPFFVISENGILVKKGYAWDGATGALLQTESIRISSLVHDVGCQAVNLNLLPFDCRLLFDEEYKMRALRQGANPVRVEVHYQIIKLWGRVRKTEQLAPYSKVMTSRVL